MAEKNQYYLKDKKIDIYEGITTTVSGVQKTVYQLIANNLWAYYRQRQGGSTLSGSTIKIFDTTERVIFVINNMPILRTKTLSKLKIKYNSRVYDIEQIDDYEGYVGDYKLNAKFSSTQTYPGIPTN